jgi:hypothetical protein
MIGADSHQTNKERENMIPKPLTPPRPLKPFRSFLPKRLRRIRGRKVPKTALKEETLEGTIIGGSAIVIGDTATDAERSTAIDEFTDDIRNMDGEKIFALAVVFD